MQRLEAGETLLPNSVQNLQSCGVLQLWDCFIPILNLLYIAENAF